MDFDRFALSAVILVGDHNWRKGPRWRALAALIFGRSHRFTDERARCFVKWWRGAPYLVSIREVG